MTPSVGTNSEFVLDASGKRFGEAGFYFVLRDAKGQHWAKMVKSFRDRLVLTAEQDQINAQQRLSLWGLPVLQFTYAIRKRSEVPSAASFPSA